MKKAIFWRRPPLPHLLHKNSEVPHQPCCVKPLPKVDPGSPSAAVLVYWGGDTKRRINKETFTIISINKLWKSLFSTFYAVFDPRECLESIRRVFFINCKVPMTPNDPKFTQHWQLEFQAKSWSSWWGRKFWTLFKIGPRSSLTWFKIGPRPDFD